MEENWVLFVREKSEVWEYERWSLMGLDGTERIRDGFFAVVVKSEGRVIKHDDDSDIDMGLTTVVAEEAISSEGEGF